MWEPLYQDEDGGFPVQYSVKHYLHTYKIRLGRLAEKVKKSKKTPGRLKDGWAGAQPSFLIFELPGGGSGPKKGSSKGVMTAKDPSVTPMAGI